MRIEVTQEDIDRADRNRAGGLEDYLCPIEEAFARTTGDSWSVGYGWAFDRTNTRSVRIGAEAQYAASDWDKKKGMKPFSFEVQKFATED